ncbi:MAG: HAD-IC family P-type ATPase [Gammaproteobacteria bacterium]|nr:HAD-IC family P-type ATPase [Gammaproteobacteria bacterium]MDH4310869.1 HAD-IC family P-type ATPase [Gammaproteobacteria bacterium]MDH5271704.1 HAD-IC family P-type ATPase [Gammaproteobacteria bacterium]
MTAKVAASAQPAAADVRNWHALTAKETLGLLAATEAGLTRAEAAARLERYGPNLLPSKPPPSVLEIGLRQLKSPLIYVLLVAAVAAISLGDLSDAAFIGVVLLLNSALGGWQEWRAEQQSQGLQKLLLIRATVLRDGDSVELDSAEVVPGDVVALESGQRVPADLRLQDAHGLEIDEALLTGESLPVLKDASWIGAAATERADCRNMAFAGTTIARGRGHGVVVATGAHTAVGRLAISITAADAGKPPLVKRMERFSRVIAVAVLSAAVFIGAIAVIVHEASVGTMFMFGIALAVSAIPEGLPVAITIALAIAARRMAGRGAIVRRLPAVEGLGSCTLIASDKTGTLTCNELTVREVFLPDGSCYAVSGAGYEPEGDVRPADGQSGRADQPGLQRLLEIAAACNEGDLHRHDGAWVWRGDPTDISLLALAGKGRVEREALLVRRPAVNAIPFEPEHRFAASFHVDGEQTWVAVKGAPERVLAMCLSTAEQHAAMQAIATDMASRGQRVLALACGRLARVMTAEETPEEPRDLTFAGLVGLVDPLRAEVAAAVRRCDDAGIRVIMVTGDHPVTALAIARELGIADRAEEVIHGSDLRSGDAGYVRRSIATGRVYARVTPDQKLAIVRAAQEAGHFVAVTGDGVNDAPALRHANIGVAMGRGGTDVARDASDVVLSDDNFATIVAGVEEGRIAYQNIRNVVYLLIAAGAAEVLTVGLAVIVGLPLPLLPVQLLWLNLVTNGIQDVALAFEQGRGDELESPPRSPGEPVFNRLMIERTVLGGLWMGFLGFTAYVLMLSSAVPVPEARNALVLLMVLLQNVDAFNARSETRSVFRIPLSRNPVLVAGVMAALLSHVVAMYVPLMQKVLNVGPLGAREWLTLGVAALSLLAVMEAQKVSWRWRTQSLARRHGHGTTRK